MSDQKRSHIPSAAELLDAVAGYLEAELLPDLEGRQRFNIRVCLNALRIVQREQTQRFDAETQAALRKLAGSEEVDSDTLLLNLAEAIRRGELNSDDEALLKLLRQITLQRLAVDNPRYSSYLAAIAED